mmetsp:Transcript_16006/g.24229  ORF Transcript_16006/g.24229 Transcript_16006/m.24229 type:complete len:309 (+) Transcript_16006:128-1054(+)|eukprot:CAMPEP_0178923264 /NCGR_PEP_ID=MMETSP0786-20121207/16621_1 /TAXON_ID=186022 /ORGANISM="Thalassionema frauenfeldii, Strain CCMP 1798" /LENGTH=308 /DNA_ID=CAMNT_0020597737 /DNA_START=69 /DNA_END=995 /DNA_ORIENTATION=-
MTSKDGNNTMIHNMLGSSMANIISRCFTHPLDTAKARMQAAGTTYRGPLEILRSGSSLYRGLSTVIIGGTPGSILYFCSYEFLKEQFRDENGKSDNFLVHFGGGMLAETVALVVYVPVDVLKERMQVNFSSSNPAYYRNAFHGLSEIWKYEGLSGIYRGYWATLMSFGPFSALYFCFYEQFKAMAVVQNRRKSLGNQPEEIIHENDNKSDLPFTSILLCSCSAGALASFITSPLDLAKLRLQVQRGGRRASSEQQHRNMVDVLHKTWAENGITGLWRGAGARVLHFAPSTTVTMTSYETFKSFFAKHV